MPILIDNFSMGVEEWLPVSDLVYFSADAVDYSYNISTSGTYFIHDGEAVTTTFSGIDYGYRFYYYPGSVYASGIINITLHAENDNSEVEEESFYLLYGYNCKLDEVIDWGYNSTVVITGRARNQVTCPNEVGESSYFETRDLWSVDLGATIRPVDSVDLGATIYPQSTAFFYSRTFKITINGIKDFNGNVMDPYIFTFTIEDPPD
jgi:hypothetical protein